MHFSRSLSLCVTTTTTAAPLAPSLCDDTFQLKPRSRRKRLFLVPLERGLGLKHPELRSISHCPLFIRIFQPLVQAASSGWMRPKTVSFPRLCLSSNADGYFMWFWSRLKIIPNAREHAWQRQRTKKNPPPKVIHLQITCSMAMCFDENGPIKLFAVQAGRLGPGKQISLPALGLFF